MENREKAVYRSIAERVIDQAERRPVEILITSKRGFFLRFAENEIHQSGSVASLHLFVRLIVGDRSGRFGWTDPGDAAIRQALRCAQEIALSRGRPDSPLPLLTQPRYRRLSDCDPSFHRLSPMQAGSELRGLFGRLRAKRVQASGYHSVFLRTAYLANSRGLEAFHTNTSFRFGLTLRRGQGIGYASDFSPYQKGIDRERVLEEALARAAASEKEAVIQPGRYSVILAPRALVEFLDPLFAEMNARKVLDGESFFTGKKGQQIFAGRVNIEDDVFDPRQTGLPFDGEGMPKRPVVLVVKGKIRNFVGNRKACRDLGMPPTGHDAGGLQPAVTPNHIVMKGGTHSLQEMIEGTKRGILISHIWYHRTVNRNTFLSTGLAKGNALLIREGRLVGGVPKARYLESVPEALSRVSILSREQRVVRDREWGASVYPFVQIDDFRLI